VEQGWFTEVRAELFAADGVPLARPISWESNTPQRASVEVLDESRVRVNALAPGRVTIFATSQGVRQGIELAVYPSPHPTGVVALMDSLVVMEPGRGTRIRAVATGPGGGDLARGAHWLAGG